MASLNLSLLGPFAASVDGRSITNFRTKATQALLIYLACQPEQAHRRDHLMTLLAPGLPKKSAQANLRQTLYQLRQVLSATAVTSDDNSVPFLLSDWQTIQINPEAAWEVDALTFESALRAGEAHWGTAVALYRGDFLADFYLPGSSAFEEWAEAKRQAYRHQTLEALERLTAVAIRRTAYTEARAYAERQIEIDNLRENAYRQLMKILALNGQRAEALALYETCQRLFAEELGMAPTTRTTEIAEQIRAGDLSFATRPTQGVRGFELKEKIGEGAYGAIYRAIQATVNREVAVKVIRRQYADDPEFIRRFESEAQTIARLEHPYIVPLYDYWREPEGAYLVMRLLRGGNLLTALEGGPWDVEPALKMLEQISNALFAAHRQGIVHRDIKPANILFDEAGNAYLSDFGIAKQLIGDLQLTAAGGIMGTPDYISPEQLRDEPVGPPADLYSLGAVLYETLTGKRPFPDVPIAMLLQKQMEEPIPPVSASRPDLPRQIDIVIQRATAKQPGDRYSDALALAEAFRQAALGQDESRPAVLATALPAAIDIINPYKGLRAFQEADAADFYGRETLVEQLVARLTESRFLAVVGPSGSGKSSLVKAGLIPALRQNSIPGSDAWFVAEMVPGDHPLEELELALLLIAVDPPPSLLKPLQKDERGLIRTLRRILPGGEESQLLLVIDQFEELFTLVTDDAQRLHFLNNLLAALNAPRSPLRLVVTLRADFYDRPLQIQAVADLFKQHTEIVLPLNQEELTAAIREPAQRMGVRMEESVVTALVTDVIDQPGALPLLQYALTELFESRQENVMTLSAYRSLGGVSGALARRAEDLFASYDAAGQEATRQLFLRLVTLGEGTEDTRRRVRLSELETLSITGNPSSDNGLPITEYGKHRLLTFDHDPLTREPTVEVAHEALLREWPRLRRWLDQSRDDVRLQRSLASFANEWKQNHEEEGFLLRDSRLDLFAGWAATMDLALTPDEQTFLAASISAREQREAAEHARQQRELETAQQLAQEQSQRAQEQAEAAQGLRRRAYYLVGALAVAVILAVAAVLAGRQSTLNAQAAQANANLAATNEAEAITEANQRATAQAVADEERDVAVRAEATAVAAGILADEQRDAALVAEAQANEARQTAEEQAKIAFSRELAAAAIANLDKDPERSVLLALHAVQEAYTQEAEEVLHLAVPHLRVLQTMVGHEDQVRLVDFSPDGSRLVTVGRDGTTLVWDTKSGQQLLQLVGHEGGIGQIAYSTDGSFIATASEDGTAKVWDAATGELLHTLSGHRDNPNRGYPGEVGWVSGVAISPDSKTIATGGGDGLAKLWDAATGAELMTLSISEEVLEISEVAFSPDGSWLAMWGLTENLFDNVIQIVDVESGSEIVTLTASPEEFIGTFAISPDGTKLLIGDRVGEAVRLWDLETGTELARYSVGEHGSIDFNPDGSLFATKSTSGGARIWETETGREILKLSGHQDRVWDVRFSPDGTTLATASSDHTARIWDIGLSYEILTVQPFNNPEDVGMAQIAFSPDGTMLAAGGNLGGVSIWDPQTGDRLLALAGHDDYIGGLIFSPDGTRLVSGSDDKTIKVWDTQTGDLLLTLIGHEDWVNNVAYSPDGATIASVSDTDRRAIIWDAATGQIIQQLPLAEGAWGVDYSPDSRLLATGDWLGAITIWDVATGQVVQEMDNGDGADDVYFTPDGTKLIAGAYDGTVKIWEVGTGLLHQEIQAHQGLVWGLAISPDGNMIATASGDRLARLWDAQSGERLLTLPEADLALLDVEFSPNGVHLATAGNDGKVRIYTLSLDELIEVAESRLTRSLTEAECQAYLHMETCPTDP